MMSRYLVLSLLLLSPPGFAQNLIPATPKAEFTRASLATAGQRPDPFKTIEPAKVQPMKLPPPPKPVVVVIKPIVPLAPTTPVALAVVLRGFIATKEETVALVSREGSTDLARVGDTILSAQVVAISPSSRSITLKENGLYVTRNLETSK
jgi:hypothetical protein